MDDPILGTAICDAHPKGHEASSGVDIEGDGTASADEEVQNNRQIQKGLPDAETGNVRHPGRRETRDGEVLKEIGINPAAVVAFGDPHPAVFGVFEKSQFTHDAVYLLVVNREPPALQFTGQPIIPVNSPTIVSMRWTRH